MTHDEKLEADANNAAFLSDPHRMIRFPLQADDYSLEALERDAWTATQARDMAELRARYARRVDRLIRCYGQCRHYLTVAELDAAKLYGTTEQRLERAKVARHWFMRAVHFHVRIMSEVKFLLGEAY